MLELLMSSMQDIQRWTLVNNRGPACARSAMFSAGKYNYVYGGVSSTPLVLNAPIEAWRYDMELNVWVQLSTSVTARSDAGVTANQNYAYLIGGAVGGSYLNDIWQFNISANSWTKLANYYTTLYGVRACNYNNVLYSVGGGSGVDTSALYTTSMSNPITWTRRRDIPIPVRSGCFFSLGDSQYLYYTMGWSNGAPNAVTYRYSIAGDTWTKVADAPRAANNAAVSVVNGKAYFYGGYSPNTSLDQSVLVFDGTKWSTLTPGANPPPKRQGASMVTIGNSVYLYGGVDSTALYRDLWELTP